MKQEGQGALNNFKDLVFTNRKTWSQKPGTTPHWSPTSPSGHLRQLLSSFNHSRLLDSVPMLGGMLPHCW